MYNKRIVALLVIGSAGGMIACENDPAVSTDPLESASLAASTTNEGTGPFLLEMAVEPEQALLGCAQAVNNEGMISGWNVIIGAGHTIEIIALWNRAGEFIRFGPAGYGIQVLGMNDRGQILSTEAVGYPVVRVYNPDGSGFELTTGWGRYLDRSPVRMNRKGDVMATYRVDPEYCNSVGCPVDDILTTHLGWLAAPVRPPWRPHSLCWGETIDHDGAVYGLCGGDGANRHYRWTARDNATQFPTGPDRLLDVWIDRINRYGEVVGSTAAGPVFWSQATGRIQIQVPPGVARLKPVALNDRGVVLLSSDYTEGQMLPAQTIAYWTRAGGTFVLPRKGWPVMAAFDINNQGVIVGCVGGDGGKELVPAYWRIQ
jgi:hypothetical protein